MEPRTLQFICDASNGELLHGNPGALGLRVCTDSRQVREGDLFIAIKGERFDAHDFLGEIFEGGAVAAMIERGKEGMLPAGKSGVVVENTKAALGRLAAGYRRGFPLTAIAVGGSNGKTSTKELVAAVLREGFPTLWSQASFNNDIGVPLTLLSIEKQHQAGVFEVGTNHPGELKPLVEMVQPGVGIITSIGREHLEFFGDLAGVVQEEGWLAELLPLEGRLFLNGDCRESGAIIRRTNARIITVGYGPGNDWRITGSEFTAKGTRIQVQAPEKAFSGEYQINLLGRHQVINATYAIAVGAMLGLGRAQIQRGLDRCKPPKMRLEVKQADGFIVLDDSYNANADSMRAALETLRDFPCSGKRIAVLGDMGELGEHTVPAHREIGEFAASAGVNVLLAIGKFRSETAEAGRAGGVPTVLEAATVPGALQQLENLLQPGDVVLVKASRSSRLDQVVEFIVQRFGAPEMAGQSA